MENSECVSSRPLSVWRCSAVWPPATVVEVLVEGSRGARRPLYLQLLTGGHCVPLFFSCFNQSAMAYMVCCGPKIRRRKLNNVFLFFKGRAMVGWLQNSFDRPEGTMAFVQVPTQRKVSSERAKDGGGGAFKQMLAGLLLNIPSNTYWCFQGIPHLHAAEGTGARLPLNNIIPKAKVKLFAFNVTVRVKKIFYNCKYEDMKILSLSSCSLNCL